MPLTYRPTHRERWLIEAISERVVQLLEQRGSLAASPPPVLKPEHALYSDEYSQLRRERQDARDRAEARLAREAAPHRLLGRAEAARIAGVSVAEMKAWMRSGELRWLDVGAEEPALKKCARAILIREDDLAAFLKRRRGG
jgi:hypothetical protein